MDRANRRKFSSDFKSKVVLEALRERSTIEALAQKYELQPTQINQWKKEAISNLSDIFDKGKKNIEDRTDVEKLYAQIGQLKVENDFLKKKLY